MHNPEFDEDALAALEEVRDRRGFVLSVHEAYALVGADLLRAYNALAGNLIFGPEPRALDLRTRFLVLLGITTAVKGDLKGVEWATANAVKYGASESEIFEAVLLAGLPAGMPAVEAAVDVVREVLGNQDDAGS